MAKKKDNQKYIYIGVIVVLVIILGFVFISNQQKNQNTNTYTPPANNPSNTQQNTQNNPPVQNNEPVITLTEAKQIATSKAYNDVVNPHPDYNTLVTESYLENGDWMIKIKFWVPNCDSCTTADKYGWFTLYTVDGGSGRIINEKDIYS